MRERAIPPEQSTAARLPFADVHPVWTNVRARSGRYRPPWTTATGSTPLAWEELRAAHAAGRAGELVFDPPAVLARVAEGGDAFAPLLGVRQELPRL